MLTQVSALDDLSELEGNRKQRRDRVRERELFSQEMWRKMPACCQRGQDACPVRRREQNLLWRPLRCSSFLPVSRAKSEMGTSL